ncbi:MAG: thioredoxin domain-containing protein [Gammaproteobacteria bacterium]|nr:thioredoxin domain-containing protein [Gammaproteobacteria bacterium]
MPNTIFLSLILLSTVFTTPAIAAQPAQSGPAWQDYGPPAFEAAVAQNKLILLDLVAVWCHWCHVMEATTYRDPVVREHLERHYVVVQADHDARPDLAERYRDYGWPATIILRSDGTELVKRAGYIAPGEMAELLLRTAARTALSDDTIASEPRQLGTASELSEDLRDTLQQRHLAADDPEHGGLRLMQKFLDADTIEWDLQLAQQGDGKAEKRARRHLDAALALIDPAFGGAYQYSTHGDWQHPHYEKIMRTQLAYLRSYSLGYRHFDDPRYLAAGDRVAAWLADFMQADNGGFATSQDADLEQGSKAHDYFALDRDQRLQRGLPRIDRNQYADINGMAIEGLVTLFRVSGEKRYLASAVSALDWVLRNRRNGQGGYRHAAQDSAGPYLADTLYMGRAFLALYEASGQPAWRDQAAAAATYIGDNFRQPGGGLLAAVDNGTPVKPVAQLDQNIHAARFLYALAAHTTDPAHATLGDHVMRYLATPAIATSRPTDAGILLADRDRVDVEKSKSSLTLIPSVKKEDAA